MRLAKWGLCISASRPPAPEDEIVHLGRRRLEVREVQKSKSTTKDFVALAGISQKGAKQLSNLTDFKSEFTDHTNSIIRTSRNSRLRPMQIDSAMNTNKARGREPERMVN